jgi:predicted DNA-binding antitoxin AbrB/MazE fold protein
MTEKLRAIYRDGAFIPQVPCQLPENAEVELTVQRHQSMTPEVMDSEARKQILHLLLQRMRQTTLMGHSRHFSQDNFSENLQ